MALFLVTGGAGFIGSNIVNELLRRGENVRVLDNFSTGKRENIQRFNNETGFELIEGDLRSFHTVRDAVRNVGYVLHQGALPSVPRSVADPITSNDVNILGTLNILEAAKEFGVKRVVFASSSSLYGNNPVLPKVETMPSEPCTPYAVSKYAAERYCQVYHRIYELETVCLRYFNIFGPNQDPSSQYSAVIPKFIKLITAGERPVIYGDGLQSRDFTYVDNVVQANLLACTAADVVGEVINIACGVRTTLLELVRIINAVLGTSVEPVLRHRRVGDVEHSVADIGKASRLLGFKPMMPLKDGLQRTVNHMFAADKG